jgi:hypothetical protein
MLLAGLVSVLLSALAVQSADKFDRNNYVGAFKGKCKSGTGQKQTPIDLLPSQTKPLPEGLVTQVQMPVAQGAYVKNTGRGIQVRSRVEWRSESCAP